MYILFAGTSLDLVGLKKHYQLLHKEEEMLPID